MRYSTVLAVLMVAAAALLVLAVGVARAEQSLGTSPLGITGTGATVLADRVVNPEGTTLQVPVTNVRWRGGYYGGRHYSGRHSGYWRPYHRYRSYYYGDPRPRCWWNGYRWICRPGRWGVY